MKKNIGSALALYPTPVVVVGAMNGEKAHMDPGGPCGYHWP